MNVWIRWSLLVLFSPILIPLCIAGWIGYALASAVQGEWLK